MELNKKKVVSCPPNVNIFGTFGSHEEYYLFFIDSRFFSVSSLSAQISHGGRPLALNAFKGSSSEYFIDMPFFDPEEELRVDSLEQPEFRSFRFAYKFVDQFHRGNSGVNFMLDDGTKVWRLGIRSQGAYSINVLFSEYELPEGAQLFLYNTDQSYILGSFNHLNNSEAGLLPVAPVPGDELIIEYQEPANASFAGRITVGEVNHAYRDLRGVEPGDHYPAFECMSPLCYHSDMDEYRELGRSVVLLIIDGTRLCTGVMVNNTSNDGTPYLLTASHCLNNDFQITNPDYARIAESIVCFFNYNSPLCHTILRGTEEMTMASASCVAVNENIDMALLELPESPPAYYFPYYAGWNRENAGVKPYAGMHHPRASVKRVNVLENDISLETLNLQIDGVNFYTQGHWRVRRWTSGSTYGGSSGSPLFDSNGHVLGLLTAGQSTCSYPVNDYYYALSKAWSTSSVTTQQLAAWLDPQRTGKTTMSGLDPYADQACYRLSNIHSLYKNKKADEQENIEATTLSSSASGYLFGVNSLGTTAYLEEYRNVGSVRLYGTYIVTPALNSNADLSDLNVEVIVYEGTDKPEKLVYSKQFSPAFTHWESGSSDFGKSLKSLDRDQESFIWFDEPVDITGNLYVGYRIIDSAGDSFMAFNLAPGETNHNTAWIHYMNEWIQTTVHPVRSFHTSLFVDPVVSYNSPSTNLEFPENNENKVFVRVGKDRQSIHILLPEETKKAEVTLYAVNGQQSDKAYFAGTEGVISLNVKRVGIYIVQIKFNNKFYHQKLIF